MQFTNTLSRRRRVAVLSPAGAFRPAGDSTATYMIGFAWSGRTVHAATPVKSNALPESACQDRTSANSMRSLCTIGADFTHCCGASAESAPKPSEPAFRGPKQWYALMRNPAVATKTSKTFQTRVSGAKAMVRSDAIVQPWPTYQPTPAFPTDTKNHARVQ